MDTTQIVDGTHLSHSSVGSHFKHLVPHEQEGHTEASAEEDHEV